MTFQLGLRLEILDDLVVKITNKNLSHKGISMLSIMIA
jgi:hypothetical protein